MRPTSPLARSAGPAGPIPPPTGRSAPGRRPGRSATVLLAILAPLACSEAGDAQVASFAREHPDGVLFLAQAAPATAVMEALFDGRVALDEAGCIRLRGPDPATVVWPYGFDLTLHGDALGVRAPSGELVGTIPGEFRLGGGEVPTLHSGIDVDAASRALAAERCPGRYWIVGEIPGL